MIHMLMSIFKHYFYKITNTRASLAVRRQALYILGILNNVKDTIGYFGAASGEYFMTKSYWHNEPVQKKLILDDVLNAQSKWTKAFLKLNKSDNVIKECEKFVDEFYNKSPCVIFRPTKASKIPFRTNRKNIMSYFITGSIKEDKGFAINKWKSIEWNNVRVIIKHDIAICMGKYYFNSCDDDVIEAEYSFVYQKTKNNKLKIILHHSSLPYNKSTSYTSIISNIMKSALK